MQRDAITYAPVKGLGLVHVDEVELEPTGVRENRRFHLIDDDGRLINGKFAGTLVQVAATTDRDGDVALTPLSRRLRAGRPGDARRAVETNFYGRPVAGRLVNGAFAEALSQLAGRPLRLVRVDEPGDGSDRGVDGTHLGRRRAARSSDRATRQARRRVDGRRFRMLFEVDGIAPHGEDGWAGRRVAIGDAVVRVNGLVGRCAVTSQNPDTGVPDLEHAARDQEVPLGDRDRRAAPVRRLGRRRGTGRRPHRRRRGGAMTHRSRHLARPTSSSSSATSTRRPASIATRSGCASSAAPTASWSWGRPTATAPLVTLIERPDAPARPRGTTGLFHLALLVPDRAELARALNRVTATGHRFTGASDHLVSEALYLDDPEGNGIEIYSDRPREEWARAEGQLQMATLPLDVEGVLASAPAGDTGDGMAAGTTLGHVHLQVASIPAADTFYTDGIGFDADGARVSRRAVRLGRRVPPPHRAQHLGRRGCAATSARGAGLRSFTIVLPDEAALEATLAAVAAAGIEAGEDEDGRTVVADPSGNRAVLATL